MSQKQQKKVTVVVTKSQKKAKRPRNKGISTVETPSWLSLIQEPYVGIPCAIPDDNTSGSYKAKSHQVAILQTVSDNASETHGLLIGVGPYMFRPDQTGLSTGMATVATLAGYNGTAFTGATNIHLPRNFPNASAIVPALTSVSSPSDPYSGYKFRPTSMEAKLTYLGTELERAGAITAGLSLPIGFARDPITLASSIMNPIDAVFGGIGFVSSKTVSTAQLRDRMWRLSSGRTPDGSVTVKWLPNGVPAYGLLGADGGSFHPDQYLDSWDRWPVIIFSITGDHTPTSSLVGNNYRLEVVVNWEVIGPSPRVMVIPITPSVYDPAALAKTLNSVELMHSVSDDSHRFNDELGLVSGGDMSAWNSMLRKGSDLSSAAYNAVSSPQGQYVLKRLAQMAIQKPGSTRDTYFARLGM